MKKFWLFLLGLALAALVVACGGAEPAAPQPTTLSFVGTDIAFNVNEATANANAPIKVTFKNEGALEHNWLILGTGTDVLTATEADALAGTDLGKIQPGEEKSIDFSLPAGEYTYVCTIPGHAAAGMVGKLSIK